MDESRRGGEKFWTRREGGAENFGRVAKGGRKILDLVNFFSKFLKHSFFMFCGYFGHFQFFGQRGGEKFWTRREGGAKNFGRVI